LLLVSAEEKARAADQDHNHLGPPLTLGVTRAGNDPTAFVQRAEVALNEGGRQPRQSAYRPANSQDWSATMSNIIPPRDPDDDDDDDDDEDAEQDEKEEPAVIREPDE
jgi:hypothetical protein